MSFGRAINASRCILGLAKSRDSISSCQKYTKIIKIIRRNNLFINPKHAIAEGWITHPDCSTVQDWEDKKFISPNAIDFTVDIIHGVHTQNQFIINENGKAHRGGNLIHPIVDRQSKEEYWNLTSTLYDGTSKMSVVVPEGIVSWCIPRSTLNRNGMFILSGLYDSGFSGSLGFMLYNLGGQTKLGVGTRVGQIIFATSENANMYEGGYNTEHGKSWKE